MKYPQIAARVFNTPLLIAPRKLDAIIAFLGPRLGVEAGMPPVRGIWYDEGEERAAPPPPPYAVTARGTAIIPVHGTLVHRGSAIEQASGLTSYTSLAEAHDLALADSKVRQIAFDVDSPGGEVSGVFDFADEIFAARGRKPSVAIVNELACSGAYLIASAAGRIITARTGYCGSIGVMTSRLDLSKANERAGVVVNLVYAGERKADGYPVQPMSGEEKDILTRDVERLYDLFVSTVARNRGIGVEAVRGTKAGIFDGAASVEMKLADRVLPFKQALAEIEVGLIAAPAPLPLRRTLASRARLPTRVQAAPSSRN